MANETLDKVVGNFQLNCRGVYVGEGADRNRIVMPALKQEESEPVVIKIYENGRSIPLCKYFYDENCLAGLEPKNHGECPYNSNR